MLISHTKKFIFIKTTKTAGTSVEVLLQKYCVPQGFSFPPDPFDQIVTDAGVVGGRGPNPETRNTWFAHMTASEIKTLVSPEIWDGYTKICNIRNPWDKTVSFFHFNNRSVSSLPKAEIIAKFRDFMRNSNRNGRDTHIYFIDGAPVADVYLRHERLTDDFNQLCEKLDLQTEDLPRLKGQFRDKEKLHYRDYYDDELRDMVATVYASEIKAFGWEF